MLYSFDAQILIYLCGISAATIVHQDLIESFLGFSLTLLYFLFVHSM